MENITQQDVPKGTTESKYWKFTAWFVGIVVIAGGAVWVLNYFSPEARYARMAREGMEQYENLVKSYQDELRADTYGGKTPEETLQMFVSALRSGDVELASKYFFISKYEDRNKWVEGLNRAKTEGRLAGIADSLITAEEDQNLKTADDSGVWFVVRDENGSVTHDILLRFNEFAGIWKIESL